MSDDDAEWIDVDKEFGGRVTPVAGPNNPRPRPTTLRPRSTTLKNQPEDAPEKVNPSSESSTNATVISISVVSSLAIVGLILVVLYLMLLKKKLKKVEKSRMESQYCLRVEDVAHMDINESASLYVNTTDLQKLVTTVRIKNKGRPPAIPEENYPEVVRIEKPAANYVLHIQEETRINNPSAVEYNNAGIVVRSKLPLPNTVPASPKLDEPSTIKVVRAVPPPPSQNILYLNKNFDSEDSFDELECHKNVNSPSSPKTRFSNTLDMLNGIQSKPALPNNNFKPKLIKEASTPISTIFVPSKPEVPPVASKPQIVPTSTKKQSPSHGSLKPKPQLINRSLPLLKVNLLPSMNRQDSGFSTPGTASTCLSDSSNEKILENGLDSEDEPSIMSVTARRARIEQLLAEESLKNS